MTIGSDVCLHMLACESTAYRQQLRHELERLHAPHKLIEIHRRRAR